MAKKYRDDEKIEIMLLGLGYNPVDEMIIEDEVMKRAFHVAGFNSNPESVDVTNPVEVQITPFNGKQHVQISQDCVKKGDFLFECFGKLRKSDSIEIGDRQLKTEQGYVIDGSIYASNWIYVQESCHPNAEIIFGSTNVNGEQRATVYLRSTRKMKVNDLILVGLGAFKRKGSITDKKKCTCGVPKCYSITKLCCSNKNCDRHTVPFKDMASLKQHITKKHLKKKEKTFECYHEEVKETGEIAKCSHRSTTLKHLNVHKKDKHGTERPPRKMCQSCGMSFGCNSTLNRHFKSNKGCTPHVKATEEVD